MTRIVLHIDRLLLRGIAQGDVEAFSEALQGELQRLLGAVGSAALQDVTPRARKADRLRLGGPASMAVLGRTVAARIVGGPQGIGAGGTARAERQAPVSGAGGPTP
ncbi:hypothetical protein D9M68_327600 [compost metagenome]